MNAGTQLKDSTKKWMKRLAAPLLALALIGSFVTYEFAKPTAAKAADAAPSAAPLDADSVGALLALDKAMETLAARVTPAVVNVTVTSRTKPETAGETGARRHAAILRPEQPVRPVLWPGHAATPARRSNTAWAAASSSRLTDTSSPTITWSTEPSTSASPPATAAC